MKKASLKTKLKVIMFNISSWGAFALAVLLAGEYVPQNILGTIISTIIGICLALPCVFSILIDVGYVFTYFIPDTVENKTENGCN